jgi:formylglycine-generating enzyme required for sulfatase activity
MVSIPGGSFRMGNLSGEQINDQEPVHSVTVPAFRLGKYEVTFAQWDACVADGGCGGYSPHDQGWGRGNRPVINVSWDDAQLYIDWLNTKTNGGYRLPTEAEWEYAARAGSTTKYPWGNDIGHNRANCRGRGSCGDSYANTAPVGSFPANAWGLHDMPGNVWEWVQDCWHTDYEGAPSDGSAWISNCVGGGGSYNDEYSRRVRRGGSWDGYTAYLRSAYRGMTYRTNRLNLYGVRVAQDN